MQPGSAPNARWPEVVAEWGERLGSSSFTSATEDRAGWARIWVQVEDEVLKTGWRNLRKALDWRAVKPWNMQRAWWQYELESGWGRWVVGRRPWLTLVRLGVVLVLYFGVLRPAFMTTRVWGHSMAPTYREGRANLVYRWAYRRSLPQRGDVVVLRKEGTLQRILKRVVALPGERVSIRDGRVMVNGVPLEEPYATGTQIQFRERELGEDEYFVVGDNRNISDAGRVRPDEILGKVVY